MSEVKEDKDREHRIPMEIIVDAYNEQERVSILRIQEYYGTLLQDLRAYPPQ
ncbi:MAG: hypothetical protein HWN68_00025 [Desulfobacterales bacterium]|nr:hypothetical protein [Desulfobacterales bacterium]